MPPKKIITETVETQNVSDEKTTGETKVSKPEKTSKEYKSNDRIPCTSITAGGLVYYSTKTKERYEWSSYGDVTDVLYEDLLSLKSAKSNFLYKPLFVINDDELISQPSWSKIKEVYEKVEIVEDANDYLAQSPERLRQLLLQAPAGLKNTIKVTASQMINSGELDSIRKIRVLDEILGTEFVSFIS